MIGDGLMPQGAWGHTSCSQYGGRSLDMRRCRALWIWGGGGIWRAIPNHRGLAAGEPVQARIVSVSGPHSPKDWSTDAAFACKKLPDCVLYHLRMKLPDPGFARTSIVEWMHILGLWLFRGFAKVACYPLPATSKHFWQDYMRTVNRDVRAVSPRDAVEVSFMV